MNKRVLSGFIAALVLIVAALWFFYKPDSSSLGKVAVAAKEATALQAIKPSEKKSGLAEKLASKISASFAGEYPPWRGGRALSLDDPRWKIVHERDRADKAWEWKMPIDFYGKVVDETVGPVPDVSVSFCWTDTSSEGTSKQQTTSDANGLFGLHGVHGKNLGVQLQKEGYEVANSKNRYGFEFAGFWEETFYEADPKNPVIFYLHRKGDAEPLICWEKELNVTIGTSVTVKLSDQTQLQFALLSNDRRERAKWEAKVSIINGGIIPAPEEFITEAPNIGYQAEMDLTPKTPKPPTWQLYEGGSFYLKVGQLYGRLDIEMIPGNDWFRVKVWINPKSGSRNLEHDEAKCIDPSRIEEVGLEKAIEEARQRKVGEN